MPVFPAAAILIAILFAASTASARVFSYKDSSVAAYLRTTGGLSSLGKTPFAESSGDGTSVDGTTKYQYSGEIGVLVATGKFNLRLGAEIIQHRPVSDAAGTDSDGDEMFKLTSSVSAFNPALTVEYTFNQQGNTRYYTMLGAGMADVTVENRYTMTTAGSAAFDNVTDYNELMSGSAISGLVGVGLETLFTDNVTFAIDAGYRYLQVSSLKYKGDVNSILVPAGAAKGDPVLNSDGSKRSLNMSGFTVGLNFRFYLNFM